LRFLRSGFRFASRFEPLEARLLLAVEPLAPFGSLIYGEVRAADFVASPETDSFTIDLDANQTLSGAVVPADPNILARIEVFHPDSSSLGVFDAAAAGAVVGFQTLAINDPGTHIRRSDFALSR